MLLNTRLRWMRGMLLFVALAPMVAGSACAEGEKETAKAPSAKTEKETAKAPSELAVPDGTPEQLLTFIEEMLGRQPDGIGQQAQIAFRTAQMQTLHKAALKVLAGKPNEDQAYQAVDHAVTAMLSLRNLGDAEAEKQLAAFPNDLKKMGRKELAREVSWFLLRMRARDIQYAGGAELKSLVADLGKFLAEAPLVAEDAELAENAASALEQTGNTLLAVEAYRSFGKILAADKDPGLARLGAKMQGAARRLGLVGKDMAVEGKFLDGKPLDWSQYRGKVVLVQFWATWCGPCREEIVNVRRNYDLYHEHGFEVLGVNCDDDRRQLEYYLQQNDLPWNNLFSDDPNAAGMDNPMAVTYGVMGIPTLILVNAEGKVVSVQAYGRRLGDELEKLLGPAREKAKETAQSEPGMKTNG